MPLYDCEAIKVLASGIIVRLGDGREGFLPRREFMLTGTRDLRQVFQPGQWFQAVGEDGHESESGRVLLQLVSQDHWDRLVKEHPLNSVVTGIVSGVEPYGIFVNLFPGVTGLVPREELSTRPVARTEDVVWVGDTVRCTVQFIDPQEHRVSLSIKSATAARSGYLESKTPIKAAEEPTREVEAEMRGPEVPPAPVRPLRLLIVDDQAELRQQLAEHLGHAGHSVLQAESALAARAILETQSFDLLVLDVAMPGMTGVELTDELLAQPVHPRIILMTDWSRAISMQGEIERLRQQGVELVTKPRHALELDQILASDYGNSGAPARRRGGSSAPQYRSNIGRTLNAILRDLQSQTNAGLVAVFSVDPRLQRLNILALRGDATTLRENELQMHWRYSPLRDAVEDGDLVVARNTADEREQKRFQYLTRILDFKSCIGVPVNAQSPAALFAFHPDAFHFKQAHQRFARAAAERIEAAIDRDLMEKSLAQMQRYVLLGQLGAVVVHEINNKFGAAYWVARKLPDDLKNLERRLDGPDVGARREVWHKAYDRIQEVIQSMSDLDKIVGGFDTLLRQQDTTRLNVHELIEQACTSVHSLALEDHVSIHTHLEHPSPYVSGAGAWLQQALLNTLLNAIQQLGDSKIHPHGHVLISTRAATRPNAPGLQVRISDDGPGIHNTLRERIFDLGFTTREHGSGIGLFMTRNLVESMGGRISIEESHVLWGTTFLIELPLEEDDHSLKQRAENER